MLEQLGALGLFLAELDREARRRRIDPLDVALELGRLGELLAQLQDPALQSVDLRLEMATDSAPRDAPFSTARI